MTGSKPLLPLLLAITACQAPQPNVLVTVDSGLDPIVPEWRLIALPADRERLDRLQAAWTVALDETGGRSTAAQVRAEGALLDPGAGQAWPQPSPGPYRCRLLRFGGRRAFTGYPAYFCDITDEGDLLALTKTSGGERPGGYLWPDGDERMIFLGAIALGGEPVPSPYGEDRERDAAGIFERVEPFRYRLVMPWPPSGATLDVLELIPFVIQD